jgi:polysaccharide biosynthesis transport protein
VDSPPLNHVSDARILGSMCDRIVVVVKAFSTARHQVRQAVDHLADSRKRIAGIVLNDFDVKHGSYYAGQYYASRRYGT